MLLKKADQTSEVAYDFDYPNGDHLTLAINKQSPLLSYTISVTCPTTSENYLTWQDLCTQLEIGNTLQTLSTIPLPWLEGGIPVDYYVPLLVEPVTMTNVPIADTELTNQVSRRQVDLRSAVMFVPEMLVSVIPATNGKFVIQYSVNGGTNWTDFYDFGTSYTANVLKVGAVTAVPAGAKVSNCILRVISRAGNGVADPAIRHCGLMIQPA